MTVVFTSALITDSASAPSSAGLRSAAVCAMKKTGPTGVHPVAASLTERSYLTPKVISSDTEIRNRSPCAAPSIINVFIRRVKTNINPIAVSDTFFVYQEEITAHFSRQSHQINNAVPNSF